jgi:hypothetical protein
LDLKERKSEAAEIGIMRNFVIPVLHQAKLGSLNQEG